MNKELLLKGCLELVTVNGRPFDIFQDSGMVKILKPITDAIGGSMYYSIKFEDKLPNL